MNTENIDKSLFEFAAFDELESEHIAAPRYSYWKSVFRTFFKNKFTVIVSILLIAVVAFALIQPTRSGYSPIDTPNINNAEMKFLKPSAEHIFGTDHVGNEVFDAVWAGARNSIIISFVCTAINMLVGIPIGALWGFSKKMDKWMIEVYNIISNVPFLLLAMILEPIAEANFRRALSISQNDYSIFYTSPVACIILGVSLLVLLASVLLYKELIMRIYKNFKESNNVTLYNGDCRKLLKRLPGESVDLVVTSPPYCIGKAYEDPHDDRP
jgi:ABC-type dipeptide/oligopeptide/nickel transport system permease subunit